MSTPRFTKKHYEAIGDIISQEPSIVTRNRLERAFSDMFAEDNKLYKRDIFQRRCDVGDSDNSLWKEYRNSCDWSNDVNPNGRIYLIERLAKNKWQAKYHDGSTKQFRTLKAARAAGIPKSVTDILTVKRPI